MQRLPPKQHREIVAGAGRMPAAGRSWSKIVHHPTWKVAATLETMVVSAERFAQMENTLRRARLTGSLTAGERRAASVAEVPSQAERKRYLALLAEAVSKAKP